ncbi:T9SS sorting signal type C domain-containing protein [Flavobacterium cheniae]|uniref:Putative secreted protein (Por secretion system target) n=1 Tax=Flavobacterium cheniae TaxID=295428 RepID=A0A562KDI6_9FLAO|nr:T9SS sorting signal type C domain-containing protein [Flavobacterium cheniae]TDR19728.1 putative secreted protein (Por secretion system target) [Flavobacterium cheniae]TWH93466.1 putative secreted protein (Por secretion system target) [Flavobacterium cheniae]
MKRIILSTLGFLGSLTAFSQMYVSPNSYVFVNDQFMYVRQDVNLQNNGNFFLRNNSQLLQGTAGAGANTGAGKLSVFQEGTTNNFQYNYWCSPVGNASAAVGNETFGIAMLNRPTGLTTSTPAIVLPTSNLNGTSSPLAISPRWIYRFITSNAYAQWTYVGAGSTINAGEGFTMKGTSGTDATVAQAIEGVQNNSGSRQRYDFRGKPNDGNMSIPVSAGNFTLVGNPYPSAIDLNAYLLHPSNAAVINGQAYFWEQVVVNTHVLNQYQGGYGIYNPGTGIYTPAAFWTYDNLGNQGVPAGAGTIFQRRFSPVGQGFMVMGTAAGSVTMQNAFRVFVKEGVVNQSQFARNAEVASADVYDPNSEFFPEIPNVAGTDYTQIRKGTAPYIRIHAMYNNGGVRPTTIAFLDTATDGFDYGADGRSPSGETAEFYYVLTDMPHEYVATAVQFDIDKRIPVGFRCTASTNFKLQVKDVVDFDDNQPVYLHDKQTGIYYDIKNGIFDMVMPAGDNRSRYEITFKNTDVVLDNPTDFADAFTVFQNNENGMLTIYNTLNKDITALMMYDVTGKLVMNKTNLGKAVSYEFSTSALSDGVYVVKTKTRDNLDVSKKVIISRK